MNTQSASARSLYSQTPGVVFGPAIHRQIQRGMHQIVDAIRPTLGPLPRITAIERASASKSPELLDSGGIIARRIIDLPNPDENVGAMFIRGILWNLHERVGDGVATSAVIFQKVFDEGLKFIATGGNSMLLRGYLEKGLQVILHDLDKQTLPLEGREALAGVAKAVCYDEELAAVLGEIFDVIGENGILEIRTGRHRQVEHNFIEGCYWPGGVAAPLMLDDPLRSRTDLQEAAILITDLEIEDPRSLLPAIQAAAQAGASSLVVLARKFSNPVIGVFISSKNSGQLRLLGAKTPGERRDQQMFHMQDIASLTGGQALHSAAGETLEQVTLEHLGRARRIWASHEYVGIVNGKGDPRQRRTHIARLRTALEMAVKSNDRKILRERIGRLSGGGAVIEIGGLTESEIQTRKELAQRTANALRRVIQGGVLPGGGAALLACQPALNNMVAQYENLEERAAGRILQAALEVPFRTLVANAGYSPGEILARINGRDTGVGFDVQSEQVVDMTVAGILDITEVQKQAVRSAIQSAALALTIDVVVHRHRPPMAIEPDKPS